jgi:hypothetical protein
MSRRNRQLLGEAFFSLVRGYQREVAPSVVTVFTSVPLALAG